MKFFHRFQLQLIEWAAKRQAKTNLDLLVDSMANSNQLMQLIRDSVFRADAQQHIDSADRDYRAAVRSFKDDEFDECNEFIDRGMLHLEIAQFQLRGRGDEAYEPRFDEGSAEHLVAHLSRSLTGTKLAIEYCNCTVREPVKNGLISVTALFKEAAESLLDDEPEAARRTACGGLLYLHRISMQLEVDNQRTIADITIPHSGKLEKRVKELSERLASCQRSFASAGLPISARVRSHFAQAERDLCISIDNIVEGDSEEIDSTVSAGLMEVKLAEKFFLAATGSRPEEKQNLPMYMAPLEFKAIAHQLLHAIKRMKVRQPDLVEKHLNAAVRYYEAAVAKFSQSDFSESDRLARAAYLDLDYARQVALSKKPPRYLDI